MLNTQWNQCTWQTQVSLSSAEQWHYLAFTLTYINHAGGEGAPDLTESLRNLAINGAAVGILGYIFQRDLKGQQSDKKVIEREEALACLQVMRTNLPTSRETPEIWKKIQPYLNHRTCCIFRTKLSLQAEAIGFAKMPEPFGSFEGFKLPSPLPTVFLDAFAIKSWSNSPVDIVSSRNYRRRLSFPPFTQPFWHTCCRWGLAKTGWWPWVLWGALPGLSLSQAVRVRWQGPWREQNPTRTPCKKEGSALFPSRSARKILQQSWLQWKNNSGRGNTFTI